MRAEKTFEIKTKPKVNVAIAAFNSEGYIERCIYSVLDQKTDFIYNIIIGEDSSTDNTRSILINLKKEYPAKIKLILNEKNLGMHDNLFNIANQCEGEYVAWLDGDDYWVDPLKLQKEVGFLEAHPECSICTTAAEKRFENDKNIRNVFRAPGRKNKYTIEDIFVKNYIVTATVVIRSKYLKKVPCGYDRYPMCDWPLWIEAAKGGSIGYIDEVTAVYYQHDSNVYGSLNKIEKLHFAMEAREIMLEYLEPEYCKYCYHSIFTYHLRILNEYVEGKDSVRVREYAGKSLKLLQHYLNNQFWQKLRLSYYLHYNSRFHQFAAPLFKYVKQCIGGLKKSKIS